MEDHSGGAKWWNNNSSSTNLRRFDDSPSTSSTTAALLGGGGDGGSSLLENLGLSSPAAMDWNQQQPLLNQDKDKIIPQQDQNQVMGFTSNLQPHSMESSNVSSCLGLISSASSFQLNSHDVSSSSSSIDYHQNTFHRRYDNYFGLMASTSHHQLQQLQFTNNTLSCNVSQTQPAKSTFEDKPMNVLEYLRDISCMEKNGSTDTKRTKNEGATSTLTHMKVRKEKMGDRITTLQQLVSPFGKTDTASVLSEAIEYIKFLHDQINVLTTPYLNSGALCQYHQSNNEKMESDDGQRYDLRSRGLCLVPVSATFPIANDPMIDLWTPQIGGSFN